MIFHEEAMVAHMVNEVHGKPKFIGISNSEDIVRWRISWSYVSD